MKKRANITEKTFNAFKIMLAGGATVREACEFLMISETTGHRLKSSETWQEYLNIIAAIAENGRKHKAVKPDAKPQEIHQEGNPKLVTVPWTVLQEMQRTNDLLTHISNKLAYIVEQLS